MTDRAKMLDIYLYLLTEDTRPWESDKHVDGRGVINCRAYDRSRSSLVHGRRVNSLHVHLLDK
jgi:hypothetical protein